MSLKLTALVSFADSSLLIWANLEDSEEKGAMSSSIIESPRFLTTDILL